MKIIPDIVLEISVLDAKKNFLAGAADNRVQVPHHRQNSAAAGHECHSRGRHSLTINNQFERCYSWRRVLGVDLDRGV